MDRGTWLSRGLHHGYFADLLGLAVAGVQLGLAFAALRDAEVWHEETAAGPTSATRRNITGLAMAEASGLWAVSAGHAAVNVVARVVRLHSNTASLDKRLGWSGLLMPFESGGLVNLSLNTETLEHILAGVSQTGEAARVEIVEPLDDLTRSATWATLVARRDAGYHRPRPQSIEGGVPPEDPWAADQTAGTLASSVSTFSDYIPPALEDVVAETQAGYDALSSAMSEVHEHLPTALRAAGIPIWHTSWRPQWVWERL